MPARRGPRFAIEALFLIALAVGVAYADLATKWIFVVMAGGWLVVALLELTADRIWAAAPPWRRPYYVPASPPRAEPVDRKSTRLNSSHSQISYAVFCLKKKIKNY